MRYKILAVDYDGTLATEGIVDEVTIDALTRLRASGRDLLMVTVLRNLRHTKLVAEFPNLDAYQARGEARPAFQRALADQLATFAENQPQGEAA